MTLNPTEDIRINLYELDKEVAKMSHLLYLYDQEWHKSLKIVNKLDSQIKNIEDSLKVLRLQIFSKTKRSDGKVTDKTAEAAPFEDQKYLQMFEELKTKREQYAEAKTNADLYQNFHYSLIEKGRNLDLLFKMHTAQYFTLDRKIENDQKSVNAIAEMTDILNTTPRRKLKQ